MLRPFITHLLGLAILWINGAAAQTQTPILDLKDPVALLAAARATNGLEGDGIKPWHLKASYELFDDGGKPLGQGLFEEWWAAKNKYRQAFTGSHYTGDLYVLPAGRAMDTERIPWPESLIAGELVSPLGTPSRGYQARGLRQLPGAKPPMSCIDYEWPPTPGKVDLFPVRQSPSEYCFEEGTANLRVSRVRYVTAVYNKLARFQEKVVAFSIEAQVNKHALLNIHVEELTTVEKFDDTVFVPTTPLVSYGKPPSMDGPPGVHIGRKISGPEAVYPEIARAAGVQGVVVLLAVLGKDGSIADLHVLESPDPMLTDAAIQAVERWKYEPYLLFGKPVEVETTINVNFNLGR